MLLSPTLSSLSFKICIWYFEHRTSILHVLLYFASHLYWISIYPLLAPKIVDHVSKVLYENVHIQDY